jgi:hypothetical protein
VLVQVKNKRENVIVGEASRWEKTIRLRSRDPVVDGVKCKPHGGKNSKTKSWTVSWLSLKTKIESGQCGS